MLFRHWNNRTAQVLCFSMIWILRVYTCANYRMSVSQYILFTWFEYIVFLYRFVGNWHWLLEQRRTQTFWRTGNSGWKKILSYGQEESETRASVKKIYTDFLEQEPSQGIHKWCICYFVLRGVSFCNQIRRSPGYWGVAPNAQCMFIVTLAEIGQGSFLSYLYPNPSKSVFLFLFDVCYIWQPYPKWMHIRGHHC